MELQNFIINNLQSIVQILPQPYPNHCQWRRHYQDGQTGTLGQMFVATRTSGQDTVLDGLLGKRFATDLHPGSYVSLVLSIKVHREHRHPHPSIRV